jgi:hypothetical protein
MVLFLLNVTAAFVVSPRATFSPSSSFATLEDSDSDIDDSTITLGLTGDAKQNKKFMDLLSKHKTLDMLGITLESVELSLDHFADQVDVVDAACFASSEAVNEWLENIDAVVNGVIDEDEKTNGNVVAVCLSKDVANTCLQSGRWESRNIYYPKGDNSDISLWVDSAVQALGDVNERRFWGGGW